MVIWVKVITNNLYTLKRRLLFFQIGNTISMDGENVTYVDKHLFLGVYIDNTLILNFHITFQKKIRRVLELFIRLEKVYQK